MKTWSKILIGLLLFLGGIALGLWLRGCSKIPPPEPTVVHDSIVVHDTAYIEKHTKPIYVIRHDTLWVKVPLTHSDSTDSLCDGSVTVPVDVPITQYEYKDTFKTDSSRIEVGVKFSGYHAKIESVDLNYDFTIPTRIVTKKQRFSWSLTIGLQGGYGATFGKDGVVEMRPYAGVGGTLGASINF